MKLPLILLVLFNTFVSSSQSDTARLYDHVSFLVQTEEFRNYEQVESLDEVAEYIDSVFRDYTDSVSFQNFEVTGLPSTYKNVIASYGTENDTRIIIGAHYDVCDDQDGADDNASGIAGLLELARLLEGRKLKYRIDLVAYSLEEPPFFRTEFMGSYIHAKSLHDHQIPVFGMICLEMIGYFSDEKKSQRYPIGLLKLFYGGKGDFITVVSKFSRGKFARKYKRKMKRTKAIKTKSFQAPGSLTGIDFSDHLNYWKFGYSAVMVTNTGFYRNQNYHENSDTIESLDFNRMSGVVNGVFEVLLQMAE